MKDKPIQSGYDVEYHCNGEGAARLIAMDGMTLREYAAIQIIAQCGLSNHDRTHKYMAENAVKQADALIAELQKVDALAETQELCQTKTSTQSQSDKEQGE